MERYEMLNANLPGKWVPIVSLLFALQLETKQRSETWNAGNDCPGTPSSFLSNAK